MNHNNHKARKFKDSNGIRSIDTEGSSKLSNKSQTNSHKNIDIFNVENSSINMHDNMHIIALKKANSNETISFHSSINRSSDGTTDSSGTDISDHDYDVGCNSNKTVKNRGESGSNKSKIMTSRIRNDKIGVMTKANWQESKHSVNSLAHGEKTQSTNVDSNCGRIYCTHDHLSNDIVKCDQLEQSIICNRNNNNKYITNCTWHLQTTINIKTTNKKKTKNKSKNRNQSRSIAHAQTRKLTLKNTDKQKQQNERKQIIHQMVFCDVEYSKDEIKLLNFSLKCLLLNVIGILVQMIPAMVNVSKHDGILVWDEGMVLFTLVGTVIIVTSRFLMEWLLVEMLVFVLKSSIYHCNKKTLLLLRLLVICIGFFAYVTFGGISLGYIGKSQEKIGDIMVQIAVPPMLLATLAFHFSMVWIYIKKLYQIASDLSKILILHKTKNLTHKGSTTGAANVHVHAKNFVVHANRGIFHAKKLLLNTCVRYVVMTGFLALQELLLMCVLILTSALPNGSQILGGIAATLDAALNTFVLVLLAPFCINVYVACCAMIHRRCKRRFRNF